MTVDEKRRKLKIKAPGDVEHELISISSIDLSENESIRHSASLKKHQFFMAHIRFKEYNRVYAKHKDISVPSVMLTAFITVLIMVYLFANNMVIPLILIILFMASVSDFEWTHGVYEVKVDSDNEPLELALIVGLGPNKAYDFFSTVPLNKGLTEMYRENRNFIIDNVDEVSDELDALKWDTRANRKAPILDVKRLERLIIEPKWYEYVIDLVERMDELNDLHEKNPIILELEDSILKLRREKTSVQSSYNEIETNLKKAKDLLREIGTEHGTESEIYKEQLQTVNTLKSSKVKLRNLLDTIETSIGELTSKIQSWESKERASQLESKADELHHRANRLIASSDAKQRAFEKLEECEIGTTMEENELLNKYLARHGEMEPKEVGKEEGSEDTIPSLNEELVKVLL